MDRDILEADLPATAAELREQLSMMTAVSRLLEERADSREQNYIASLNRSVCRMLRIVNRMELAHRLTDEHELRLDPAPLDLTYCVEELARKAHDALLTAGITLEWDLPVRQPFRGDRALLEMAVTELLVSAAESGTRIRLSMTSDGNSARVTFTVEGDPILAPVIPDGAEQAEDPGLSNARLVAQLHGGALVTESEGGLIRTLTMVLPHRPIPVDGRLASPDGINIPTPGFDPVLVALSHLLSEKLYLLKQ